MAQLTGGRPPRLGELELLRTVSFIAVIAQHVIGAYVRRAGTTPGEQAVLALLFALSKFAVPTFVFVSGAVLFLRYYGRLNYGQFLLRRLGSIVIPYLLWAALTYAHALILTGAPPCGKREFLVRILTFSVGYHTWYVGLILQFYVLLPGIFWVFRQLSTLCKSSLRTTSVLLGGVICYLLLVQFAGVLQPISVIGKIFYDLRAQNSLYYAIYFLLGGVCALHGSRFLAAIRRWTVPLALVLGGSYIWCVWVQFQRGFAGGVMDLNWMGSLNPRMTVFMLSSILLLYRGAVALSRRKGILKLCTFVGAHSFSGYLCHVLVLNTGSMILLHLAPGLAMPIFYGVLMLITLLGAMVAGWVFDWIYSQVRHFLKPKN